MNKLELDHLMDKYLEGRTSLQEEEVLKNAIGESELDENSWFQYTTKESEKAPNQFAETLWKESKINSNKSSYWKSIIIGIFLGLGLIIAGFSYYNAKKSEDYEHKKQLLEEAIRFANASTLENTKEILYTDNTLTIYILQNQ